MPTALITALLGLAALAAAALLLRSLGSRFRIGRILAATPQVSLTEALALADGAPVYVRVSGRISSTEEFPDEHDRPLVFRRTRIEVAKAGGWRSVLDEREAVPFGIEARDQYIAIDEAALGPGVIAIPREAVGSVADLPAGLLEPSEHGVEATTPARLTIEQLSAVEHATVCGRPLLRDGKAVLSAWGDRPLIVTTLEVPAAMRLLAAGRRNRVVAATLALVAGLGLLAASVVAALVGL